MTVNLSSMTTDTHAVSWLRICVTGGIACGKSLVGKYLAALGVAVIEADTVCHGLMRAGMPLFPQIVATFGRAILASDGEIDRLALGRRVFADAAARAKLNALLHPVARDAIEAWVRARRIALPAGQQPCAGSFPAPPGRRAGARRPGRLASGNRKSKIVKFTQAWSGGVVAIVPLLYETGWAAAWDRVICVGAPVALQRQRLCAKGFTAKEANDRLASQWPVEDKMKFADYVVFNAGTRMCAQRQTVQVMQQIGIYVEKSDGR